MKTLLSYYQKSPICNERHLVNHCFRTTPPLVWSEVGPQREESGDLGYNPNLRHYANFSDTQLSQLQILWLTLKNCALV